MYIGKPVLGRRQKILALLLLGVIIMYILLSHYMWETETSTLSHPDQRKLAPGVRDNSWDWLDKENQRDDEVLHSVPLYLMRQHKCPACFGDDICDDILNGDLQIEIPKTETSVVQNGVYFGRWQGKDIVVKTLDNLSFHNFGKFDEFICMNQSLPKDCDVNTAILNPRCIAVQESSFLPENLQQAWRIAHSGPSGLSWVLLFPSSLIFL